MDQAGWTGCPWERKTTSTKMPTWNGPQILKQRARKRASRASGGLGGDQEILAVEVQLEADKLCTDGGEEAIPSPQGGRDSDPTAGRCHAGESLQQHQDGR